ncbi:MAG: DUF6489 family protein [bacterium]|nr:hypothetical protein [Gammaproteobacteria bacterium]HIL96600.1 hypothetical protein [Pseudomonadales bacterium]
MKITIDVDITPEERRSFIGLPNVESLQQEMLNRAQQFLKDSNQTQYKDIVDSAMQPMMAYQSWLQKMMGGTPGNEQEKTKSDD